MLAMLTGFIACKHPREDSKFTTITVVDSLVSVDMIDSLLDHGSLIGAEHCIELLLERDSNNCAVYYKRGRIQFHLDSLAQAKSDLNKVIKLGCRKGDAYYLLCLVNKKEKKYETALLYLDSCLIENSNDTVAIKQRGKILILKNEELTKDL